MRNSDKGGGLLLLIKYDHVITACEKCFCHCRVWESQEMGFLCLHEVRPSLWSYVNVFRALEMVGPGPVQYCQCVHPEAPLCCQEVLKSVTVLQVYKPSSTLDNECHRCSVAFLFTTGICLNICFPLPHSDAPSVSPLSPLPQRLLRQVTFSKSS